MFFKDKVFEIFKKSLEEEGLCIKGKKDEDVYIVQIDSIDFEICLGNIRREFNRERNPDIIKNFVKNVANPNANLPSFHEIKDKIRFSLEAYDCGHDDFIYEHVSDIISKVIVFTTSDEQQICWVNKSHLEHWGVERNQLLEIADDNMSKLFDEFNLEIKEISGMKLAMFPLKKIAFKASLISCSKIKDKVSEAVGWPIFVVVPARDFIYAFAEKDKELLNRVGSVVVKEYNESAYPLSKEVFLISDEGIKAIGSY